MRNTGYSQSRQIYANNLHKQPKSQTEINYYQDMGINNYNSGDKFKQKNIQKESKINKQASAKANIAPPLVHMVEPRKINYFKDNSTKDTKNKNSNIFEREPQTMFKKLQDFYDNDQAKTEWNNNTNVKIQSHANSTTYNDFSGSKNYSLTLQVLNLTLV